ncbi:MAG: T9SS type A sorting domain-containing protein, partial [Bacteroidota bacterium]
GLVEVIQAGDPLSGPAGEHVGKLKAWAWLGPEAIDDPATDTAGVGWVRIEDWWPYQRPTFITPPFAGYVSGHSTFSRAAAEVLTQLTGDPFFPGGLGSFQAPQNAFLVFEEGPSVDVDLQWATYRDAADQCALSRIWGGIHPPADDLPGRTLGAEIGPASFAYARRFFDGTATSIELHSPSAARSVSVYPNPAAPYQRVLLEGGRPGAVFEVVDLLGRIVQHGRVGPSPTQIDTGSVPSGLYLVRVVDGPRIDTARLLITNGTAR